MFSLNVDVGQIVTVIVIGVIGWLIRRTINEFGRRLDHHDERLFELNSIVMELIGSVGRKPIDNSRKRYDR